MGRKMSELGVSATGSLPLETADPQLPALSEPWINKPYRPPTVLQLVKRLRNVNHTGVKCDTNLHLIKAN